MTEKRFRPKIRWREQNTPIMKGHMHIDIWIQNYVARLPKIRKNMMHPIRRKFTRKRGEK
jgi:hypothetical protein